MLHRRVDDDNIRGILTSQSKVHEHIINIKKQKNISVLSHNITKKVVYKNNVSNLV